MQRNSRWEVYPTVPSRSFIWQIYSHFQTSFKGNSEISESIRWIPEVFEKIFVQNCEGTSIVSYDNGSASQTGLYGLECR